MSQVNSPVVHPASRGHLPRWLQHWWIWLTLLFAVTFFSFWPSFFSAITDSATPYVIHGFSATGWMLLAIAQAALIRSPWRANHRIVGYASLLLAAVTVVSGVQMIKFMVGREPAEVADRHVAFFYVDATGLLLFVALLWRAVQAARQRGIALHLRLIACTAIIPLEAALERFWRIVLPEKVPDFKVAYFWSLTTLEVLLVVLIASEWWFRRLRWPFPVMLAYYLLMHVTSFPLATTPWFREFALWFGGLGGR
jgi:hypothetical protein